MFLVHSIRLRHPWHHSRPAADVVQWERTFHRPRGLEKDDLLWLMVAHLPAEAEVRVNGQTLPGTIDGDHSRFDLTTVLADANRVAIAMPAALAGAVAGEAPTCPYDVRLAIVGQS